VNREGFEAQQQPQQEQQRGGPSQWDRKTTVDNPLSRPISAPPSNFGLNSVGSSRFFPNHDSSTTENELRNNNNNNNNNNEQSNNSKYAMPKQKNNLLHLSNMSSSQLTAVDASAAMRISSSHENIGFNYRTWNAGTSSSSGFGIMGGGNTSVGNLRSLFSQQNDGGGNGDVVANADDFLSPPSTSSTAAPSSASTTTATDPNAENDVNNKKFYTPHMLLGMGIRRPASTGVIGENDTVLRNDLSSSTQTIGHAPPPSSSKSDAVAWSDLFSEMVISSNNSNNNNNTKSNSPIANPSVDAAAAAAGGGGRVGSELPPHGSSNPTNSNESSLQGAVRPAPKTLMDLIQEDFPKSPRLTPEAGRMAATAGVADVSNVSAAKTTGSTIPGEPTTSASIAPTTHQNPNNTIMEPNNLHPPNNTAQMHPQQYTQPTHYHTTSAPAAAAEYPPVATTNTHHSIMDAHGYTTYHAPPSDLPASTTAPYSDYNNVTNTNIYTMATNSSTSSASLASTTTSNTTSSQSQQQQQQQQPQYVSITHPHVHSQPYMTHHQPPPPPGQYTTAIPQQQHQQHAQMTHHHIPPPPGNISHQMVDANGNPYMITTTQQHSNQSAPPQAVYHVPATQSYHIIYTQPPPLSQQQQQQPPPAAGGGYTTAPSHHAVLATHPHHASTAGEGGAATAPPQYHNYHPHAPPPHHEYVTVVQHPNAAAAAAAAAGVIHTHPHQLVIAGANTVPGGAAPSTAATALTNTSGAMIVQQQQQHSPHAAGGGSIVASPQVLHNPNIHHTTPTLNNTRTSRSNRTNNHKDKSSNRTNNPKRNDRSSRSNIISKHNLDYNRNNNNGNNNSTPPSNASNTNPNQPKTLLEEFKHTRKTHPWTIHSIQHHIIEFCQDQNGSRFIQSRLDIDLPQETQIVFHEIVPHGIRTLRNDVFGNYVIQKLLERGTYVMKKQMKDCFVGEVVKLSLEMYGCRVVQKALETWEEGLLRELLTELDGEVLTLIQDQNGNHVIQKCIQVMSLKHENPKKNSLDFILRVVHQNVESLSCHPYGCRVLQRILEHCQSTQKIQTLNRISTCHERLLDDQYGNYVIQHVLQFGRHEDRDAILNLVLMGGMLRLSRQKFASNVVEKLLQFGSEEQRDLLVGEMVQVVEKDAQNHEEDVGQAVVLLMVRDPFANYVVQTTLDVAPDGLNRQKLLDILNTNSDQLRSYTFAKHIVAKLSC